MIELAVLFLVVGIIASMLGFTSLAGASYAIAKIIGVVFLIGFLILVVVAWGIGTALF
jgi:uncharacterized membrane protein YtjA (UPF0391 family)